MKTVLFDLFFAQPLDGSKFHGGGEYIKKVFQTLVEGFSQKIRIIAFYDFDAFLDDWIKKLIIDNGITEVNIQNPSELHTLFEKYPIDVFYTGMPYHYCKKMFPDGVYKIGTFHGMRAVECPHDQYEYKYILAAKGRAKAHIRNLLKDTGIGYGKNRNDGLKNYQVCLECFDKIVTVSEHSKYSLVNYFTSDLVGNIEVLYSPLKKGERTEIFSQEGRTSNLLILGANRWIKNAYRAMIAIDDLYSRGKLDGITTTVLGGINRIIKKDLKNPERFEVKGYIEDRELESLYCKSILVYPTLNEGFGYPPLEAMYYGSTCIVSAVCSLQEICGEAVYYVNPTDIGEIQNRVLRALENPIPKDKVIEQYQTVAKRQEDDLQKLCCFIAG